ncbi:MAG: hypothetical protein NVV67_06330 [Pseudoxanthomonas sp.]|nr:hypothetical protein [Pseudoxanthomonas sp.]
MDPRTWLASLLPFAALMPQAVPAAIPEEIQVIVFEHTLPKEKGRFVYCLGVDGQDASAVTLERLQHTGLPLFRASECTVVANPHEGSVHATTGRPAIFYFLRDLEMDGSTSATIRLETYHHGLWGSGNTLRLEKNEGSWRVAEMLPGWVS